MKKYRVIDWIDAEDHWEVIHEVHDETDPAPGEMIVITSHLDDLERGDIIDGQGNLFKKHEKDLTPPYGNIIEILTQEKSDCSNAIAIIQESIANNATVLAMYNNNVVTLEGWLAKGYKDTVQNAEGVNPDLVGKTLPEQIEYYRNKANTINLADETKISEINSHIAQLDTQLAGWIEFKQKWDAENLN